MPVFGKHGLILCTHYDGSFFAGFHVENLQYLLYCCVFSVKTDKEISRRTAHKGQAVLPLRNRRKTGGFWGLFKKSDFLTAPQIRRTGFRRICARISVFAAFQFDFRRKNRAKTSRPRDEKLLDGLFKAIPHNSTAKSVQDFASHH